MSGILDEIAAAKSLTADLYNLVCRLKSAGLDIGDLDLRLRNDRLLLSRYYNALSQRLSYLSEQEIKHLRDCFRNISSSLRACAKKLGQYEKKSKLRNALWSCFGKELMDKERKVAE